MGQVHFARCIKQGSSSHTFSRQRFATVVRKTLRRPQFWFGLLLFVPSTVFYAIFAFRPIIMAFPLSLQVYNLLEPGKSAWVGLQNYRSILNDPLYPLAAKQSLEWLFGVFVFSLPVNFAVALCVATVSRWRNAYQGLIYLPTVIPTAAIMLLFRILLDPDIGQVNQILRALHLPASKFLNDASTAMPTLLVINTWKNMGSTVVILAAGLLNVPEDLYEAARIDGVNTWQKFWHMTLPLISHTLLLVTVMTAISATQELAMPLLFTGGGPGNATLLYNMLLYREAFERLRFGAASAGALLQFAVILVLTFAQFGLLRPRWSY